MISADESINERSKEKVKNCKACLYVEYFMRVLLYNAICESKTDANKDSVDDALRYTADSLNCFRLFQGHRVRVCNQQIARIAILRKMSDEVAVTKTDGTEGLITIDWAMNYEGERKSESQVHGYGKRGYAWHVCFLVFYNWDAQKEEPVPVYVSLDQVMHKGNKKCAMAVLSMLEAAMTKISDEIPQLKLLHVASDNASNYHRKELVLSIPILSAMSNGVKIQRIIHSETQDGKGGCDSHCAIAKRHVRQNYLLSRDETTEYKKVDTPRQLAAAIASNGGIQNNGKLLAGADYMMDMHTCKF
jgi:hypothetical protein